MDLRGLSVRAFVSHSPSLPLPWILPDTCTSLHIYPNASISTVGSVDIQHPTPPCFHLSLHHHWCIYHLERDQIRSNGVLVLFSTPPSLLELGGPYCQSMLREDLDSANVFTHMQKEVQSNSACTGDHAVGRTSVVVVCVVVGPGSSTSTWSLASHCAPLPLLLSYAVLEDYRLASPARHPYLKA